MGRILSTTVVVVTLAASMPAHAQVSGKCVYNCDVPPPSADRPTTTPSTSAPSGPTREDLVRQQMLDTAGQLGAAIGASIGRQLSGQVDRDKAQDFNNQAIAAANAGDWHRARSLTLQALKLVPDDAVLKGNLAHCDRQIAELERWEAQQRRDSARAREAARAAEDARRREDIARNVEGQLKLGGDTAAAGSSQWFKNAEPDPALVASAANALPYKFVDDGEQLRDVPDPQTRESKKKTPPAPVVPPPPKARWPEAPTIVQGQVVRKGGVPFLPLANTSSEAMRVSVCLSGGPSMRVTELPGKSNDGGIWLPEGDVKVLNMSARPITATTEAFDACASMARG